MLTYFLDKALNTPLYEQLYIEIKKSIVSGDLKADEKLPSKRKLAQHLKVSVITIENAYLQLIAEGYIKSKIKSGYFVLPYISLKPQTVVSQKQIVVEKSNHHTQHLIDFRTNLVDEVSFPYDKLAKIEKEIWQYDYKNTLNQTSHLGYEGLRMQIAKLLFDYRGIVAKPESIVIGSGSENLISLLVLLIGREKVYGVEEPGYLKNYHLYKDYGAISKTFHIDDKGINIASIHDIDIVHVTPSHQFPSGIVTPISRRMSLLNWVNESSKRYIIEDDYDSEFRFSGRPIPALKSLDHQDKVIYLNSFSKSIAPSMRVSFMVLPDHLMYRFNKDFYYLNCSVPMMTQLVLERFIKEKSYEKHLSRMKNIYKTKRDQLIDLLMKTSFAEKLTIKSKDSGLHFLMDIDTDMSLEQLIQSAEIEGIKLYGINEYYLNKQTKMKHKTLVMGYSHLNNDDINQSIKALEKAWHHI